MYIDQFFHEIGAWFQASSTSIWVFAQGYRDHWVLGGLVTGFLLPLADLLYNTGANFLGLADTVYALEGRVLQDNPARWIVNKISDAFPGFDLFVLDPIDHLRRLFSGLVFPGMPVSDDLFTWLLDCGDELFPGFRLFILDPLDYLRRQFSDFAFSGMPVSDDLFTWLLDCGDELFPGFRLFIIDPTYQLKVMIADLFGARVDLFDYPGKWAIYWVKNALLSYRDEYKALLLPELERLLRYFWEGVF